jgi:His-Xaa-Ser system radical SAM maturase HxsC
VIPLGFHGTATGVDHAVIGRVTHTPLLQSRADHVLVLSQSAGEHDLSGYAAVLCGETWPDEASLAGIPLVADLDLSHIHDDDVVRVEPRGYVRSLYRRNSPHNTLFATERCNSFCLMCSQPPRNVDDSWRVAELIRTISLIHPDTREIGLSGGEPTLLKDGFLDVVRSCRDTLPGTALHVLSNGRLFYYGSFARALADIGHPDVMIGIPLYSDLDGQHDHVVQVRGAFDETVVGLQNLGRHGVPVEIRVVVHALTYERLPQLAEFIYRNFTFAAHVAFMGLEQVGFAVANLQDLWIDPADYAAELGEAVHLLADRGMTVSVYNHQLCTVPCDIWPWCVKSISDWKNEYLPVCSLCGVRDQCGGFFTSVVRRRVSRKIDPILQDVRQTM